MSRPSVSQVDAHNNGDCWTTTCPICAVENAAEVDEQDMATAQAVAASIRALIDPMSGRIDNWSNR